MLTRETVWTANALLYPVTGSPKLLEDVDWIIESTIRCNPPELREDRVYKAIDEMLSSENWLDEIAASGIHSESDIKNFLSAIKAALLR